VAACLSRRQLPGIWNTMDLNLVKSSTILRILAILTDLKTRAVSAIVFPRQILRLPSTLKL